MTLYSRPGSTAARISPASACPSSGSRNSSTNFTGAPTPHRRARAGRRPRPPARRGRSPPCAACPRRRGTAPARDPRPPAGPAWPWPRRHRSRSARREDSRRSLDRARLQLLELLLVLRTHLAQQTVRGHRLGLVDLRQGEADVDQDPVTGARLVVALEQADVDRPPYARHVDPREPVGLVADLQQLPRDGEADRTYVLSAGILRTRRKLLLPERYRNR